MALMVKQELVANRYSFPYTPRIACVQSAQVHCPENMMAKAELKASGKKASNSAPTPVKPVKQTLTKSALINLIAEENEIPRKTAAGVYGTLENLFLGSVHPRGVGEFVLPGLLKVNLRKVPARKAGALVRNPATGETVKAAAKPASVRVKIRALSKLRTAAGP
jgi:nucleoid DNA-binding protein